MSGNKAKRILVFTGIAVLVIGAAALAGGLYARAHYEPLVEQATNESKRLEEALKEKEAEHQRALQAVQQEVQASRQLVSLLQARRAVASALDELDARNFGLSQKSAQRASRLLTSASRGDDRAVEAAASLDELRFEISGDLDGLNEDLRAIGQTIDTLIEERSSAAQAL